MRSRGPVVGVEKIALVAPCKVVRVNVWNGVFFSPVSTTVSVKNDLSLFFNVDEIQTSTVMMGNYVKA